MYRFTYFGTSIEDSIESPFNKYLCFQHFISLGSCQDLEYLGFKIWCFFRILHEEISSRRVDSTNIEKTLSSSRVFAKAEFTNLNSTKKVRILFVNSDVEMDLRKRNRFSVCGNNLWSRSTKFENIVEFVTFILWNSTIFLVLTYFLWNRICEVRFRRHST